MGYNTKIDWCDTSWNPVTGCLHGCEYCYARNIANRFGGFEFCNCADIEQPSQEIKDIMKGMRYYRYPKNGGDAAVAPYPFGFTPTIHRDKLDEPQKWTQPRTIFVCSMADLFGEWVPDKWIQAVFDACRKAPQHRYLFLTKNPDRYDALEDAGMITPEDQNFWLGSTVTVETRDKLHGCGFMHTFQSCEPMLAPWPPAGKPNENYRSWWPEWVIFGAETGNRKGKVIPEKAWVDNAVQMCRNMGAKVFMKESLREIMGDDFRQEFPWSA